jgi:uncharacterized membrane protein YidH (DUF202 family)
MEEQNMMEPESPEKQAEKKEKKKNKKRVQQERTRTAFERLQLAWVRTSLTLLTIGVGAYEYFYNRHEQGKAPLLKLINGRDLGMFLILLSFVLLLLPTLQHIKNMATLKEYYTQSRYSMATLLSLLVLGLSFVLSVMVIIEL